MFFSTIKNDLGFFQINGENTNKKSEQWHKWREMAFMWSERGVIRSWSCREVYFEKNGPFFTLFREKIKDYLRFLVATKRLYMSVCPSVRPSVGWSVGNAFAFRPTWSDLYRVFGLVYIFTHFRPDYVPYSMIKTEMQEKKKNQREEGPGKKGASVGKKVGETKKETLFVVWKMEKDAGRNCWQELC